MTTRFYMDQWSWAFDDETAFGVKIAVPTWNVMRATPPEFTFGRDMERLNLAVQSNFTSTPLLAGSRHGGTFTFQVPLRSMGLAYDGSAFQTNPEVELLTELFGAVHSGAVKAAGDVAAASTAVLFNTTATVPDEGAFVITTTNASTAVTSMGWVTDVAAGPPKASTLFEDAIAIPASGEDIYGALTLYPAAAQPTSKNFFLRGPGTTHGLYLLGCVITGATIRIANGKVPTVDFSYMFDGWIYDDSISAGLLALTDYVELPAVMGVKKGRLFIDGTTTGTADATGTCGIGEVTIELTTEQNSVACHGGPQGYSAIEIARNPARISFSVPWTEDDIAATGESVWDTSLEDGTTFSLSMQVGDVIGGVMGMLVPAARIVEQPSLVMEGKTWMWNLVAEPSDTYAGDTGSAVPANEPIRLALG